MKRKVRFVLILLLSGVFLFSGWKVVGQLMDYREGEETYQEAAELVELPDFTQVELPEELTAAGASSSEGAPSEEKPVYVDPYAELLRNMDFTALREVNSDVRGWIVIPGTAISYPLLQGTDNAYYLNHTYKKTVSAVGAIFMDSRCSDTLTDFNTIIYGHRMNNGSMFAGLKYYKKQSYWQSHPTVYITTDQGTFTYRIFSAYEGSASGESYRHGFSSQTQKQAFLDTVCAASVIETGIVPTVNDYILTLSTCTGNGHDNRWIVHAMRQGPALEELTEPAAEAEEPADAPATEPAEDGQPALPAVADGPEGYGQTADAGDNDGGSESGAASADIPEESDP